MGKEKSRERRKRCRVRGEEKQLRVEVGREGVDRRWAGQGLGSQLREPCLCLRLGFAFLLESLQLHLSLL